MQSISKELWDILELVRSGELNPVALEYLKNGFGSIFAKYLYDKDLTYLKFLSLLEEDLKSKRIKKIDLVESLSKIYYLHRDLKTAIELKKLELEEYERHNLTGIERVYYDLANKYYENSKYQEALENINKAIDSIDTRNLSLEELKLLLDSLIMQNQLKQELKYPNSEIINDIKYIENIYEKTNKYLEKSDSDRYYVMINYLYLSHFISYGRYEEGIKYGEKIVNLIDNKNINLKFSLKYMIYENLAMAFLFEKRYHEAIEYAKKGLNIKNSLLTLPTFGVLSVLAEAYYALKEFDEALSCALEANSYVSNSIGKLTYLYEILTKIYASKGDEIKAREYLAKLRQLKDILQKERIG